MRHSERGRRSHPHAMPGHTHHDEHLRHHEDSKSKTHLENAVSHLDEHKDGASHYDVEQHAMGDHHVQRSGVPHTPSQPKGGEPHPHEKADHPGV